MPSQQHVKEIFTACDRLDGVVGLLYDLIALIKSVAIENIKFDPAYEESIRKRMQAEVEVAKVRQDALREIESAKIANTKADAEAYQVKVNATAQAESIQKRGDAEAASLRAKGAAIAANPRSST